MQQYKIIKFVLNFKCIIKKMHALFTHINKQFVLQALWTLKWVHVRDILHFYIIFHQVSRHTFTFTFLINCTFPSGNSESYL